MKESWLSVKAKRLRFGRGGGSRRFRDLRSNCKLGLEIVRLAVPERGRSFHPRRGGVASG